MYYEDPELSLRCWRRVPCRVRADAVVVHRYELGATRRRCTCVERNRLIASHPTGTQCPCRS